MVRLRGYQMAAVANRATIPVARIHHWRRDRSAPGAAKSDFLKLLPMQGRLAETPKFVMAERFRGMDQCLGKAGRQAL